MRFMVAAFAVMLGAGLLQAPAASARPVSCDESFCTPGILGGAVLGAPCANTAYYVFGTTSWGRIVFCGSPRGLQPRYFRSPPMVGVKLENDSCEGYPDAYVAQAPDGLFLTCVSKNDRHYWERGDL